MHTDETVISMGEVFLEDSFSHKLSKAILRTLHMPKAVG
jgi:hypothetical protein